MPIIAKASREEKKEKKKGVEEKEKNK